MDKLAIIKGCAAFVIGSTTATLVKEIVKNNTDPTKVTDKAAVVIGSYVLGAIAADATKKWTDEMIDKLVSEIRKHTSKDKPTV